MPLFFFVFVAEATMCDFCQRRHATTPYFMPCVDCDNWKLACASCWAVCVKAGCRMCKGCKRRTGDSRLRKVDNVTLFLGTEGWEAK